MPVHADLKTLPSSTARLPLDPMLPSRAAIVCLALSLPSASTAQDAPDLWRLRGELGLNGSSGNSSFTVLRTGGSISRVATELFEFEISGLIRYGKSEDRVIADDQRGTVKFDWRPDADFSPFTFVSASRDAVRRIDLKLNGGVGAKWTFLRRGRAKASWSLAGIVDHEDLRLAAGATVQERRTVLRWSARLKYDHDLGSGAAFQHVTFWQPEVADFGDYLIEMSNSLSTRITENLSLALEHEYLHDQVPPPGVGPDDQRFSVVLRVTL